MAQGMETEVVTTDVAEAAAPLATENGKLAYFNVEKKIGKGQFSEVYRAKHKMNEGTLALKKVQVSLDQV